MAKCTITILSDHIYLSSGKAFKDEKHTVDVKEADDIIALDEGAGRMPRIEKAKRGRKNESI